VLLDKFHFESLISEICILWKFANESGARTGSLDGLILAVETRCE
jgi:hypothetical protein